MIAIDNVLLSDEILTEQFVCNLEKCKGGCCVDGDAGAPLDNNELKELDKVMPVVKSYMTQEGLAVIAAQGNYVYNEEFGWVTPVIKGKMCAYGTIDQNGIVKCGIEQAWLDGKITWKKPISCHLFPIRLSKSSNGKTIYANYEPREDLCSAACKLGKELKVPVYKFLKEPLFLEV